MKPDPILKELWDTKDRLAREADYDPHRFLEKLRLWEAEHPHAGPVAHGSEELRQLVTEKEYRRSEMSTLVVREAPPSDEEYSAEKSQ